MIDRGTFCKSYIPMAKAGKSALEIGKVLGVDKLDGKDTDEKVSQFVSQKASIYRKELKLAAEKSAKEQKLNKEAAAKLVEDIVAKIPKLKTRTRNTEDFVDFLDSLLDECDEDGENTPE